MDFSLFLKGVALGFTVAAPVGPIGILCIRRTLSDGRLSGLFSGLGAATADALYGSVAGFGLTAVSEFLNGQSLWLRIAGGCFLCYLGGKTLFSKPSERPARSTGSGKLSASYASTFFLTVTNPMTILSFVGVFTGLGLVGGQDGALSAGLLVAGVFGGSALWWLLLSVSVGMLREKMNRKVLGLINWLSGLVIISFGAGALFPLLIEKWNGLF